jgi:hypothetical protein
MRELCYLLMKHVTHDSESLSWATSEAKICIISPVGGSPLFVRSPLYSTSSISCCGLSFCCEVASASIGRVWPRILRPSVERSTPYLLAQNCSLSCSPGFYDSNAAIASSIGAIMVKLSRLEVVELRRVLVFGGHYATPGITRTDTGTVCVHSSRCRPRLYAPSHSFVVDLNVAQRVSGIQHIVVYDYIVGTTTVF